MGLRDLLMNHGMAEGGLDLPDVLNALAKGAVLVDVRTAREYEAGHAPGARLVNPKELLADPFTAVYGDDPLAEPNPHFILVCDTGSGAGKGLQLRLSRLWAACLARGWGDSYSWSATRSLKLTSRNGCQRLRRTSSLTEAMFHPGVLHNNPHKNISLLPIGEGEMRRHASAARLMGGRDCRGDDCSQADDPGNSG